MAGAVAVAALNALPGLLGSWICWAGDPPPPRAPFWVLLRVGQGSALTLAIAVGSLAAAGKRPSADLFYLYALLPLAIAFVAEQLRAVSAQMIMDQRGLEGREGVASLAEEEQQELLADDCPSRDPGDGAVGSRGGLPGAARRRHRPRLLNERGVRPALHAGPRDDRARCRSASGLYIPRRMKLAAMTFVLLACAVALGACGSQGVSVAKTSPYRRGAVLFRDHCPAATRWRWSGLGLGYQHRQPSQDQRAQLQHPQGERRTGPLRDPQRRLLRRDHAREHRRRLERHGDRGIPCQVLGSQKQKSRAHRSRSPPNGESPPGEPRARPQADPGGPRGRSDGSRAPRGGVSGALEQVLQLDRRRRLLPELEGLRAQQNEANDRIRRCADAGEREREIAAMRAVASSGPSSSRGSWPRSSSELQAALPPCPTCPTRPPPPVPRTS